MTLLKLQMLRTSLRSSRTWSSALSGKHTVRQLHTPVRLTNGLSMMKPCNMCVASMQRCYASSKVMSFDETSLKANQTIEVTTPPPVDTPQLDLNIIDLSNFVVPDAPSAVMSGQAAEAISTASITIADLHLTWWLPTGWICRLLEVLSGTMPWWAAIAVVTLGVRMIIFPIMIKQRRNTARMSNFMPRFQEYQKKTTEAKRIGDMFTMAKYAQKCHELMTHNDVKLWKSFLMPAAQAPIFICFFMALRAMVEYPVESMKTGGALWFVDLTTTDPYYGLPALTAATLYLVLKAGVEFGNASPNVSPTARRVIQYGMPVMVFGFGAYFESALSVYWLSSNIISLGQVLVLNQEPVRKYFNLPKMVENKRVLPKNTQPLTKRVKEVWSDMSIERNLRNREQTSQTEFKRAGIGPIKKTYKYDPTAVRSKQTSS